MSADSLRAAPQAAAPEKASAESELTGVESEETDLSASLHPDLWRAMVSETSGVRWYLDLDSLQVLRVTLAEGGAGHPVVDDPQRYVEVPTLATERQRAHARRVLTEQVGAEQAAFLTAEEHWLRHFHEHASPELRQALSDARRAWVIGEVRTWLRSHDVPEHRFVRVGRAANRETRAVRPPRARLTVLREVIHRAVDRMTERELESLAIPARLLLDD